MTTLVAWKEASLGEVCEFKYGKSLPEAQRTGGAVPVYGSNGVVGTHDTGLTQGPTIVIGRKGSFGEVNYSPVSCWPIDTTYYVDKTCTDADLRWLTHRLSAMGLNELNRAAAVPGLNRDDAYRKHLLLPPLPEQRRIAAILDQADALRAKRRAAIAQLDTLAQSIFLDMFGDLTTNPKGWTQAEVGDLCERVIDCPHSTPVYSDAPTPYACIRSSDIQDGELVFVGTKYVEEPEYMKRVARGTPRRGDVVYCREGARFGNVARITGDDPVCLGQRMMLFRARDGMATSEYLWGFLRSPGGYRQASSTVGGSASPHVNIREIIAFRIQQPPFDLQCEYTRRVRVVDCLKARSRCSLARLDELFASLQHRAFRGEH